MAISDARAISAPGSRRGALHGSDASCDRSDAFRERRRGEKRSGHHERAEHRLLHIDGQIDGSLLRRKHPRGFPSGAYLFPPPTHPSTWNLVVFFGRSTKSPVRKAVTNLRASGAASSGSAPSTERRHACTAE